ncbi:hypothetical protein E2P81_ATG08072 [Venturia nashicola]|nr:hypothetical protein E2P81_ATG08072 [Venturia nashicola]
MSPPPYPLYTPFDGLNEPDPPSRILLPSQLARNYRIETLELEDRAHWWREDVDKARSTMRVIEGPTQSSAFWKRFTELPGEVRNQIYDEIIQPREHSPNVPIGIFLGKSYHATAVYSGSNHLPRSSLCKQDLGSNFANEILDRWCSTVAFHLVESLELNIKPSWLGLRANSPKCSSPHLGRYLDPAATCHLSPEFDVVPWFPRMRKCYLKLNLFRLRSLLKSGTVGRENFKSFLAEVADFLKRATTMTDLRIDIVLWAQKMPSAKERGRPKFINTDDVNYSWEASEQDTFASHLDAYFDSLKEVPGIQTIRVYGVNLIDAWWTVEDPDSIQCRVPSVLSRSCSSQRHFIPAL